MNLTTDNRSILSLLHEEIEDNKEGRNIKFSFWLVIPDLYFGIDKYPDTPDALKAGQGMVVAIADNTFNLAFDNEEWLETTGGEGV